MTSDKSPIKASLQRPSPFELAETMVHGRTQRCYVRAPADLVELCRRARSNGSRTFLVAGDRRVSYAEVMDNGARLARSLASYIAQGDRVGLALPEDITWVECFLALLSLGAVVVLLGHASGNHMVECCRLTECHSVIVSRDDGFSLLSIDDLVECLPGRLVASDNATQAPRLVLPDDDAIIAFTSGSSGTPKGVILTHRGVTAGLWNMLLGASTAGKTLHRRRPQTPCAMILSPLSHVSGYCQMLLMLALGGKVVLLRSLGGEDALAAIQREKVTTVVGATTPVLRDILDRLADTMDLSSLVAIHSTGTLLADNLRSELARALPHVSVGTGYGLTETNGTVCSMVSVELRGNPHCCGRVLPSVDCMIADHEGLALEDGRIGVIWLRGAMMMRAYCGRAASPHPDGWFDTGDIGYLSDGHLFVIGRAEGLITTAQSFVACQDVERWLARSPTIDEAVVLKVGNEVHVIIATHGGAQLDVAALRAEIIASYDIWPIISLYSSIPHTRTGKPDRERMRRDLELSAKI